MNRYFLLIAALLGAPAGLAQATEIDNGVAFDVTGPADVAPSIQRMVLAHANVMQGVNDWSYQATTTPNGARLTLTVPPGDLAKIKALGFFGVLTAGMHHQAHHLMIASGMDPRQ